MNQRPLNPPSLSRYNKGQYYEQQARSFLEQQGLLFVSANYRCRQGEIDLIMREHQTLVFVEVRYRAQTSHGGAAASVTRNIPTSGRIANGATVERVESGTCCGMAGTFGLKHGPLGYDLANAVGEPLFQSMREAKPDAIISESSVCAMHLAEGTGMAVYHPLELLGH